MKGDILSEFNASMISEIVDVTPFVKEQKTKIDQKEIDSLVIPEESIFAVENKVLSARLGLDTVSL